MMLEFLQSLVYIEIGQDSVLLNVKWLLVVALCLMQMWIMRRALMSFRRK
jgi:hypothetical protein